MQADIDTQVLEAEGDGQGGISWQVQSIWINIQKLFIDC